MILKKAKFNIKKIILTFYIEYLLNIKYSKFKKILFYFCILILIIFLNTCSLLNSQYRIYKTKLPIKETGKHTFIKFNNINFQNREINFSRLLEDNNKKFILYLNGKNEIIRIDKNYRYVFFQTNILKEYITSFKAKSFKNFNIFIVTTDKNIYIRIEFRDFINFKKIDNTFNNERDNLKNIELYKEQNNKNKNMLKLNVWVRLKKEKLRSVDYIETADIMEIGNKFILFVGTSFSGLYYRVLFDNNLTLVDSKFKLILDYIKRTSFTSKKSRFFEQISDIITYKNLVFIGYGFGKGIDILMVQNNKEFTNKYYSNEKKRNYKNTNIKNNIKNKNKFKIIKFNKEFFAYFINSNINIDFEKLESIKRFFISKDYIFAESTQALYKASLNNLLNKLKNYIMKRNNNDKSNIEGIKWVLVFKKDNNNFKKYSEDEIKGIYLPPSKISSREKIIKQLDFVKSIGLNAVVVDFKDDFGNVNYLSNVKTANMIGATRDLININFLLNYAKKKDIHIIARIVSFKDPKLFSYKNNKYAFIDKTTGKPWVGLQRERWVDPASEFVQKYLIDIVNELSKKGIFEVQFDYVRYPSDGKIKNILSRFNIKNYSKNGVLYSFLKNVKSNSKIPISTDFYGYQCFYKISNHIGQDLYLLSNYINAIYPMYYPSHFSKGFYQSGISQDKTNYYIYNHGVKRVMQITNNKVYIRPWIQAFNWKVNINYVKYIQSQIDGLKDAGINSFIFWNSSGEYSILKKINF